MTLCLRTNLDMGQSSNICTYTVLNLSWYVEIQHSFTLWTAVSADIQNCHLGHETPLANPPDVAHVPSFYPRGLKLSLFSLYMQRFPRDRPIFKIAIFGHETWQVAKVPEVAHGTSFCPRGLKLILFLLYGQQFSRYGTIFKIAMFGYETWQVAKVPEFAHTTSF